jgi:eukaryotic-like serine/threonine-protein kinase
MTASPVGAPRPPANGAVFAGSDRDPPKLIGALVGSLVLNRFLIERRIGSGGFGVVYEAWDGRLERPVAVKAIEQQGEAARRVLREAQAAARLNHPGIVTLYEMGEEDGNALLVTELVEGSTLARLAHSGELSDREIGEIGADLCEALDHAHSRGVVHRDIKPQNVQITDGEPRAKLMDFGIARLADDASITATGDVVGTLAYMSPEQAEGRPAGPEADVYSLALVLYECWSGENPHRRGSPAATARAIGGRHRSLRRLRPDLPRELTDTIDACLSPRPRHRPSLEELGTAIEDSLEQLADHTASERGHVGARLGALVVAAGLGAWLAIGHGAVLP